MLSRLKSANRARNAQGQPLYQTPLYYSSTAVRAFDAGQINPQTVLSWSNADSTTLDVYVVYLQFNVPGVGQTLVYSGYGRFTVPVDQGGITTGAAASTIYTINSDGSIDFPMWQSSNSANMVTFNLQTQDGNNAGAQLVAYKMELVIVPLMAPKTSSCYLMESQGVVGVIAANNTFVADANQPQPNSGCVTPVPASAYTMWLSSIFSGNGQLLQFKANPYNVALVLPFTLYTTQTSGATPGGGTALGTVNLIFPLYSAPTVATLSPTIDSNGNITSISVSLAQVGGGTISSGYIGGLMLSAFTNLLYMQVGTVSLYGVSVTIVPASFPPRPTIPIGFCANMQNPKAYYVPNVKVGAVVQISEPVQKNAVTDPTVLCTYVPYPGLDPGLGTNLSINLPSTCAQNQAQYGCFYPGIQAQIVKSGGVYVAQVGLNGVATSIVSKTLSPTGQADVIFGKGYWIVSGAVCPGAGASFTPPGPIPPPPGPSPPGPNDTEITEVLLGAGALLVGAWAVYKFSS